MSDLLRWIWSGIRAVSRWLWRLAELVWRVLSSAVSWVVAAIGYVVSEVYDWIASSVSEGVDAIRDAVGDVAGPGVFPEISGLAAYYLGDVFAMDEAFRLLVLLAGTWLLARAARLVMIPIRALLEIL